ncbi:putative mycofactocin system creatinine amidohydrolase family protein MftE [Frankia canadensis]|uniref:Putative mycofactocin system creatinine amidohydrolase family protein MftE n=1 Tax=Frankia canadensis TaxID=1836972 RepID=A0A2I2KKH3_9ACTN|nr:mycofactocin biosynthesis peptidyl-dipeptidase MftE [Frankia canadensis]SNQ46147.1 putative mycofactocin system creatinine amidohydrolase family protein MftE [Frankia canadensis]SOU53437.1 putative mycofactocin system creatinine amidohydrolase family protein MftE [Frankia canadensis]
MAALGRSTWPELAGTRPLVLLPLGSTEQHGPHLPLDTDTRIARAVARGLADRLTPLLVAPALPFGASGEHAGFAGTLSAGTEALAHLLVEIVRSADDTAAAVVLVNAHGGNLDALRAASRTLALEGRPVHLWSPSAALAATVGVPAADRDLHAGRAETSLLLHLAPELVRLERATAGVSPPLADLIARGVAPLSPSGVLGDPAGASAAEGARLLEAYVQDAVDRLLRWARRRGLPVAHPPAATAPGTATASGTTAMTSGTGEQT